jgi:hypothetical protein
VKPLSGSSRVLRASALLGALAAACSARNDIGEACETAGSSADCEEGAVCTNESGGGATCRKICTRDEDCAAAEKCKGVTGSSIKSCQPDG